MKITDKGVTYITDDDEEYLTSKNSPENGIFVFQLNANELHDLLVELIKKENTSLIDRIMSVHCGNENVGFHCGNEFRSNMKRAVCPNCGKIVTLT